MKPTFALLLFFPVFSTFAQFAVCVDSGAVSLNEIVDASGMASSKLQDSVVWVCNGHGSSYYNNKIYALNTHGILIAVYLLKNTQQINWEDMASGPGPDPTKSYLYVGEIGDNGFQMETKTVYRFVEPLVVQKGKPYLDSIKEIDKLNFVYPDSMREAEALMIDPLTKDYYIITKLEDHVRLYRAAYPQPTDAVDTLEFIDSLPYTWITAADISQSGLEILIKNYSRIYYCKREAGESVLKALLNPSKQKIPYIMEPVGEGLCWSRNADGYFTLSEERDSIDCRLYYYARTGTLVKRFYPTAFLPRLHGAYQVVAFPYKKGRLHESVGCFDLSGRAMQSPGPAQQPLIFYAP